MSMLNWQGWAANWAGWGSTGPVVVPDDYSWIPTPGEYEPRKKRKKKRDEPPEETWTEPVLPPLPKLTPRPVEVPSIAPALAAIQTRRQKQALRALQARKARELEDDDEDVLLLLM